MEETIGSLIKETLDLRRKIEVTIELELEVSMSSKVNPPEENIMKKIEIVHNSMNYNVNEDGKDLST